MKKSILYVFILVVSYAYSQPAATPSNEVVASITKKQQMTAASLVKNLPFKNIGPSIMSGRVVDLAVNPKNPIEFYVAYASGGVWHTKNNGSIFR